MSDLVIRDPVTGAAARVSGKGSNTHLDVNSIMQPELEHISAEAELAFSWMNADYNYAGADTILLVQNTDSDNALHITKILFYSNAATVATVHTTNGASFTPTGTAVTGVNLNRKSGKTAGATAIGDETANTQGNVIASVILRAGTHEQLDLYGAVILGNGDSVAVDYVSVGTAAIVTIFGFYE